MQHEVQVQRNLVHKMLLNEYPEGLQFCCPSSKNKEKKKLFSCDSPLDVVLRDGHEKLWVSKLDFVCIHWVCMDVSTPIRERSFLDVPLRTRLRDLIPHPEELKPTQTVNTFLYLKERFYL